jgi:hypothetical protein
MPPIAAMASPLDDLHELARTLGTDKHEHGFTLYYPSLLNRFRTLDIDLLEIGVLNASSLRLWKQWMPNASVFGADNRRTLPNEPVKIEDGITIIKADQHSLADVRRLATHRPWSVVIDDGSHKPTDQLVTFMEIFPRLVPRGVYIIEDIETNYWARGYGRGYLYNWNMKDETNETDVVGRFIDTIHMVVNRYLQCHHPSSPVFSKEVDSWIGSVTFIRNAIAVVKRDRPMRHFHFGRGKFNCWERRFDRARSMPRSVEEVLADTPEQRLARAAALREPASKAKLDGGLSDLGKRPSR